MGRVRLEDELRLEQVCYTYPKASRTALDEVLLAIPAYSTVGLVGSSGSGETTTIDIILGLRPPSSGRLVVDGKVVSSDRIRNWQKSVGYVPQQIFLADDSVAGDIAFGLPESEIDMAAIECAARIANLHQFVVNELPERKISVRRSGQGQWG